MIVILGPDSEDQKPSMTRKLRRRPNDPVIQLQAPQEKRRKPPPVSIINYMLREHEIEQDIKTIKESMASLPTTSTAATSTIKLRDTINSSSIQKSGWSFNLFYYLDYHIFVTWWILSEIKNLFDFKYYLCQILDK